MSVTEAAKRLGVGRQALSSLLNGRSSLSAEMAKRLATVFDADIDELLRLQVEFNRRHLPGRERELVVRPYVPPFLQIKAGAIDAWANRIEARDLLAVLLRRLVVSTHDRLSRVTFPGYDDAQRHGWDGVVEAASATPWIPAGLSCWEFGTDTRPGPKAEQDYQAALERCGPGSDRRECTFVFVTPRRWPKVADWAAKKQRDGHWKAVKALDATDLEAWLEQSIPGQIWLAEQLEYTNRGVHTLALSWDRWSSASSPRLTPEIFRPALSAHRETLDRWLTDTPREPLRVTADSKDEAIAFLACLFQEASAESQCLTALSRPFDLVAVFDDPGTLRKLAKSRTRFLPIVWSDDCERELAPIHRRLHCITVRPRNAVSGDPDITLDLLDHKAFANAMESMGLEGDEARRLELESGRSPTILRRRLSAIDAIRTPSWASDGDAVRALIPMMLVGAWNKSMEADRTVLAELGRCPYQEIETAIVRWRQLDDSPVWTVGQHRGVASKIDALFAIAGQLVETDLRRFFDMARQVLAESDPAVELPREQRWAASLYGKERAHSGALRAGICETLVLLSLHGNHLWQHRLGMDLETEVSRVIQSVLTPLTPETLFSQRGDLPHYAEAAPGVFLDMIECDLRRDSPVIFALLRPADPGLFGGCPRTGLLWALESLAWKHLARVSLILARLSKRAIDDNWINKPINSLKAIYSSRMPQTAVPLDERKKGFVALVRKCPDVAWEIAMGELAVGRGIGDCSYRPRWRSDATGAGEIVERDEAIGFWRFVLDIVRDWEGLDAKQVGDLVERVGFLPDGDQVGVWDRVVAWGVTEGDSYVKATVREKIRRWYLTGSGARGKFTPVALVRARRAFRSLEAHDLVLRHWWLFSCQWIEPNAGGSADRALADEEQERSVERQRTEAMEEIWESLGMAGVRRLLALKVEGHLVGAGLVRVLEAGSRADFLRQCLDSPEVNINRMDPCLGGFLWHLPDRECATLLQTAMDRYDIPACVRLLRVAPFRSGTWRIAARAGSDVEESYWRTVTPSWSGADEAELTELIDHLLAAGRPHWAFGMARRGWSRVETSRCCRVLRGLATASGTARECPIHAWDIRRALESLSSRSGVTTDEMAELEFMFLGVLEDSEHGVPNLENAMASSPALYFRALALVFRRSDDGEDPEPLRIDDPEHRSAAATKCYRLLSQLRRLPGTQSDGTVDSTKLLDWVKEVRRLCQEHDRSAIGDEKIGALLARVDSVPEQGSWPREEVCEVLERIGTRDMEVGFQVGVQNARGVHWRPDHGGPERGLAARFRTLARTHEFTHPFVSRLLERIASDYGRQATRHDVEGEVRKRLT